jgi:hypothetical protein
MTWREWVLSVPKGPTPVPQVTSVAPSVTATVLGDTTNWVPEVVSVTRAAKLALAMAVLGEAFAKLVFGSARQM